MNGGDDRLDLPPDLDGLRRRAWACAAIGGVLCAVAWAVNPARFVQSYLVGFLFWVGISAACLAVVMLHQLVGGLWGFLVRRPAEAGASTLPWMALLFLPIALGLRSLYPWADPSRVRADEVIRIKTGYLNPGFFLVRAAIYFGVWSLLALAFNRWSAQQDRDGDPGPSRRLQGMSGPGLVLYFLAVTFAMIDWGMSLEPDWFSSIYGAMLLVGQVLATLAVLILVASRLAEDRRMERVATAEAFNDLGNLLLAFVMLWAYMSFSQYLITWSGNLADEIPWYLRRSAGGWRAVAAGLILFHFFVPFFLLLSRGRKRNPRALARVCWAILVMRLVDICWLILPAFEAPRMLDFWAVVPAMLGIGGLWVALFLGRLGSRPLLPLHEPLLAATLEHHGE
jgi:hypothetical protein